MKKAFYLFSLLIGLWVPSTQAVNPIGPIKTNTNPASPSVLPGAVVTAFKARDIAAEVVAADAAKSTIAIYGFKNDVGVMPDEWLIWFYDPTAWQSGRRVRVRNGSAVEITEGYTELEKFRLAAYKANEVIPFARLKIDSDEALSRVKTAGSLMSGTISSATFNLRMHDDYIPPIWQLVLFTIRNGEERKFGEAWVSAETGQIIKLKLN